MEDSEARLRLSALEERLQQRDAEFALLQCELARQSQIERRNARLEALEKKFEEHSQPFEMQKASLEAAVVRLSRVETELERHSQAQESAAAALTADVGALQSWRQSTAKAQDGLEQTMKAVTADVRTQERALTDAIVRLSRIEAEFARTRSVSTPQATATPRIPEPVRTTPPSAKATRPASAPPIPALDSVIISDFPEIFAEFRRKKFSLLWRGGRDGFGARDFHSRCDGHANL
jgi:hypothetical protein